MASDKARDVSEQPRPGRATIRDIAERAGVSKGAVSYALNGRPGVSEDTRERIISIANELGWYPNRAARALSAARAEACGLVLARPARTLALEPFFMEFIAGVEAELATRSVALTLQLVGDVQEEIDVYRRWWGSIASTASSSSTSATRIPASTSSSASASRRWWSEGRSKMANCPAVWHDEGAVVTEAVQYLVALGHGRIAHVAGVADFVHTAQRMAAFTGTTRELGVHGEVVETDYSAESGARATRKLLSSPSPPTAIVFDSDLLAVTGLGVAQQMGFSVPEDVSIVGWDDSLISQVVHPALTAITRDIEAFGVACTQQLLAAVEGQATGDVETMRGELTTRGSTGRPRRAAR